MLRWVRHSVRAAGDRDKMLYKLGVGPFPSYFTSSRSSVTPGHVASYSTSSAPSELRQYQDDAAATGPSTQKVLSPVKVSHALKSMGKCRDFLSTKPNPLPLAVHELRNRYKFWRAKRVLGHMTSSELSSLICLLGTLSISEYGHPQASPYTHPRAFQMDEFAFAPHWAFIEEIIHDKGRLRYPLLSSDHYWQMRAHLARFWVQVQIDPSLAEPMLTKAGKQYLSCCAAVSHLDVHAPFFEALAASPSPVPVHHFAMSLITTLRANRRNNDNISYAIFHLVLRCRNRLSDDVKEQLLHVVSANIAGRTNVSPSIDNGLAEVVASDPDVLIAALEIALFTPGDIAAGDPITRWSTTVASRLFAPDSIVQTTVEVRWHCIILLALARTRSTDGAGQAVAQAYDPVQQAAVVEWRTVCVLATLDNFFRSAESHGSALENDVIQGFSQLVRKLWKEWSSVHPSVAPPRPLLVARIICASFMRLGGQLKDKALVEVCRDFCVATGLWSVRETQPATEAGLQLLAAEQLYASLVCGTFFERALVDLMVYTYDLRILRSAVDSAIVRYLQRDPEHAQELAAWATSRAVPPSDTVVADVGVALAKHGVSGFLDRYLDDTRLAPELRAKVALAHLRMYMRHGRRFVNPAELIEKMDTFVLLATQLEKPHSFLAVFRGALLVLVRHQYAPQVVKIVQDASAKHPLWFSELFYTHLLRVLLDHRQFRLAQLLFKLHRVRAKKLLFKHLGRRMSRNALLALARTRSGRLEQPKVPVNTASSTWTVDSHTWHQTVHALVKRGGFVAAKQLFDAVRQRASSHAQTVIGNTILHGYVLRRRSSNHRRLEMVLDTFKQFKEQYDFAPDHVTVNIMLKAQLRSTEDMDARMARQLFDVLVRSGYPTGMSAAPPARGIDTPPFGMDPSPVETVIVGKLEIPRIQAPLWYRSHVKPLYKTFVKAFYLRGDVAAARKVVGIMKILEAQGWRRGRRV